jgi:hypothetical protein
MRFSMAGASIVKSCSATSARNSGVTPYRLARARNFPVANVTTGRCAAS